MAKLVEILARELNEWPEDTVVIAQDKFGITMPWDGARIYFSDGFWYSSDGSSSIIRSAFNPMMELSDDYHAYVTRAQWQAERARIAVNQQATQEAQEIASKGTMTNEEQELAAIACGKGSKEDQALWDAVAKELFTTWTSTKSKGAFASVAFECADAFMAERAKRLKGGV